MCAKIILVNANHNNFNKTCGCHGNKKLNGVSSCNPFNYGTFGCVGATNIYGNFGCYGFNNPYNQTPAIQGGVSYEEIFYEKENDSSYNNTLGYATLGVGIAGGIVNLITDIYCTNKGIESPIKDGNYFPALDYSYTPDKESVRVIRKTTNPSYGYNSPNYGYNFGYSSMPFYNNYATSYGSWSNIYQYQTPYYTPTFTPSYTNLNTTQTTTAINNTNAGTVSLSLEEYNNLMKELEESRSKT